jgi:lysophospholipid acyltransferase (LPLAT)-like uncharacterized protein
MQMHADKTSSLANRKPKVTGPVVPNAPRWFQRLGAWVVFALVRGISATLRFTWIDGSEFFGKEHGPVIYCIWHNRLALCMTVYQSYARKFVRTPGMAAMVSASKDGALLAAVLERFKVQPVRGSSSRRGPQALLELTTWAERGYDLAITPDGPRGPRYVVQQGIMSLAQITGLPILPVSYHLQWKVVARSWDRFQIPLPFSRCEVTAHRAFRVPKEASRAELEVLRAQLEKTLKTISIDD